MPSLLSLRATALTLFCVLALWTTAPSARAHAVIIDSVPTVGAELESADSEIALHFNSRIDHLRSRLTLVSADGRARPLTIVQDGAPDLVTAKLAKLEPGRYRLRWQVLAIDGHLTRGDIPFSVKAP